MNACVPSKRDDSITISKRHHSAAQLIPKRKTAKSFSRNYHSAPRGNTCFIVPPKPVTDISQPQFRPIRKCSALRRRQRRFSEDVNWEAGKRTATPSQSTEGPIISRVLSLFRRVRGSARLSSRPRSYGNVAPALR